MEAIISSRKKRQQASFIPYRRTHTGLEFFLQKRTNDAPTNPGMIGNFGGGVENSETFDQAIFREIKEELEYVPQRLQLFCRYETATVVRQLYIEEVSELFESQVIVREGESGSFLPGTDVVGDAFTKTVKILVSDLMTTLNA